MARTRRLVMFTAAAGAILPGYAMSKGPNMNEAQSNKAVVARFIEVVWREGQLDQLPSFWTVDCVNHADPSRDKNGLAALRRYHESFGKSFADFEGLQINLDQQVAERDRVVTQMTTRAHHKPTGRQVSLATIRIDRLEGAKIAEHWSLADMAGLAQQLA